MTAFTLIIVGAHALLLAVVYAQGRGKGRAHWWLLGAIVLSAIAAATLLLPESLLVADKLGRGFGLELALIAALAAYGGLVIGDLASGQVRNGLLRVWLVGAAVWFAATLITALLGDFVAIGRPNWPEIALTSLDVASLIAVLGLGVAGLFLLGVAFYQFYLAVMPEVANRALFWASNTALLLLALVMTGSGFNALVALGLVALLVAMVGATYAFLSYRVIDIRGVVATTVRTFGVLVITAVVILLALLVANRMRLAPGLQATLILTALALVVALIYVPARQAARALLRQALAGRITDPTAATRVYSQKVSEAIDLSALVETASSTVMSVLRVRRAGLLLVNRTGGPDDSTELAVIQGGSFRGLDGVTGHLASRSPVYQALAANHQPILQFDLECSQQFKTIEPRERDFFRSLQMAAYVPIVVERAFIGILSCGPKLNDTPFSQRDLALLATLGQQTGVALRNSRLVADLRHLNTSMNSLNSGLAKTKEQLEKLDSVKTDFVTIASHELRTPLAQIRGYTDIIEALNQQGMLDQDQLIAMVSNLRKATERMEELISAMLDVSQLDVNAMDLRFAPTTAEVVMRMAIEPLTDAIKQRRLTLSARGLKGLPSIQADLQRLVQAFRNIIVNAVKFTPDGGHIEITAALQGAKEGEGDRILISIQDSGVGINPEHLSLVFNKFYRTGDPALHSTGTYKFMGAGPGLGLTIAKGVVEGHGGRIWAESPGHDMEKCPGTTFHVLLPLTPPESARRVLPFEDDGRAVEQVVKRSTGD